MNLANYWEDTIIVLADVKPGSNNPIDITLDTKTFEDVTVKWLGTESPPAWLTLFVENDNWLFACNNYKFGTESAPKTNSWNQDKTCTIAKVPPGRRILIVRSEQYKGCQVLEPGQPPLITLDPQKVGTISGKVLYPDGMTAPDKTVSLYRESLDDINRFNGLRSDYVLNFGNGSVAGTKTDQQGSFKFSSVIPGRYMLRTSENSPTQIVEVKPGSKTTIQLTAGVN